MNARFSLRRTATAALAASLVVTAAAPTFAAGGVTVTLNGNTLNLNPAPTERAGRVFVPLRGVFENLGASVVYANGVINATGRGHNVSLRIGSTSATVDGRTQTVDVAPFIVGASTYVPLRFVSQALGATVNYNNSNRVVSIDAAGAQMANNMPSQNTPPSETITPKPSGRSGLTLGRTQPERGTAVEAQNPTVAAEFTNGEADPNTIRVTLDGLDVTDRATRSPRGIVYAPPSPLLTQQHKLRITGKDTAGAPFDLGFSFTSGTKVIPNDISNVNLTNGQQVGIPFAVTGHTLPNAHVIVTAGVTQQSLTVGGLIGAILGGGNGGQGGATARNELNADADGNFRTDVTLNASPGAQVGVKIDSTDTRTGAAAKSVTRTVVVK